LRLEDSGFPEGMLGSYAMEGNQNDGPTSSSD
jgi:hypothetical protein